MKRYYKSLPGFVLVLMVICSTQVKGDYTYTFNQITNNGNPDIQNQLSVIVSDPGTIDTETGANQVLFTFHNEATDYEKTSIELIAFDDGTLLGQADIINGFGVDFLQDEGAAWTFPGGNAITPKFTETALFGALADNPAPFRGVNPDEQVGILFNLKDDKVYEDVLDAISLGLNPLTAGLDDALRIGIHVIGFPDQPGSDSESYILVPVPATILLGLLGLGVGGWKLRRNAKKAV